MLHIRYHLVTDMDAASKFASRPDYLVIRYMKVIGMLSQADFDRAMSNNLKEVPLDYQA